MKPWREVCIPHPDVLEGTFQQSEFAADISAVREGRAPREYGDAAAFFQRTYITEGMGLLLTQVAQRLNGKGGEPVIQLQTAFGGGKTHTMVAVYHLATRPCELKELAGIPGLMDRAGLMDVPRSKVAVLDGTVPSPGQPWSHGSTTLRTLWGELAWQLGGEEGFELVRASDQAGTSPGKEVLRDLLARHAPCVVLVDELVTYIRNFEDGKTFSGGTYDSNLSFVQALTEAVKQVPTAILLASLPESEVEAGSARGVMTLRALEKVFGRVQALWKPVASEEAFEIVRRRLFEPIRDMQARNDVCREFAKTYIAEGNKLPSETQEARYLDRLTQAYPIHPEIFDRLYGDWTTLDSFQRTRGVLKLMAQVIFRLWQDQNKDLMIMPGSLPLYDGGSRNNLLYYLPGGWDAVLERDIDGDNAETTTVDNKEPRFGAVHAARRVARTIFLGSAPSSSNTRAVVRGVDRARVLLGCLQPGQPTATFSDALNRLQDRLHYLNSSGEKEKDTTRYWFDTRANLRREMEDRKGQFEDRGEVRKKIGDALKKITGASAYFEGTHIFTPHGDIPDDSALRLVFLPPDLGYSKGDPRAVREALLEIVHSHGSKARFRGNRLVFVAADQGGLLRLRDTVRTALAWGSIVEDIKAGKLNIDRLQEQKAKSEQETAEGVVLRAARECFKWLLCPGATPADREPTIEAFSIAGSSHPYSTEIDRLCKDNVLVIAQWSFIHLQSTLQDFYWKDGVVAVRAAAIWEDFQKYLYMPRLTRRAVLEQEIIKGAAKSDLFGTARGQSGDGFDGLKLGDPNIQYDDDLLLVEPRAAKAYEAAQEELKRAREARENEARKTTPPEPDSGRTGAGTGTKTKPSTPPTIPPVKLVRAFDGSIEVSAATAKVKLVSIAEEIIALLAGDPDATVKISVEISAEFPQGASTQLQRAVSENAQTLGFKTRSWE